MSDEEILTPEEKDALLKGVEDGDVATEAGEAAPGDIRPFNFAASASKLLDRFARLTTLNEQLASDIVEDLTRTFRVEPVVTASDIKTRPQNDFVASLGALASIAICELEPLKGKWLFVIESKLLYILVDRYFGGKGRAPANSRGASFTQSETKLAEQTTTAMLANLKNAWAEVIELSPSVIEIESNPEYLTLPISDEPVIQLSFDIGFGEDTGSAHFILPYAMLEPVSQKFSLAAEEASAAIRGEWADAISQQMRSAEVELRAELPSMKLTFQQLLDLVPGDVVPIKSPDDVVVKAGHVEVFQGKFGTAEGQNAVKITQSALSD